MDEIRCHSREAVLVAAPVQDISALDLEALAAAGALAQDSFDHQPDRASRPFDRRREGFVPAHGGAAIVIEPLDRARARGANVYGEVVAVGISTDATSLPVPSREGQARAMCAALRQSGLQPADIDYVCGHFTSTMAGDRTEAEAIADVFGRHADVLRVNATKSLIGHTMGASGLVELVAAVLQMRAGRLHGSLNVDEQDPAIRLNVCAGGPVPARIRAFMKNAFGFGGLNASMIVAASQP
jgi:3-oxoacyl-(acyl-carrier-protein) synthase